MTQKAFCLNGNFYDWESGSKLPIDYAGIVVDYSNPRHHGYGNPVFETSKDEFGDRVWVFVDWTK